MQVAYQPVQAQLNLPQLAFEMVRQVQAGPEPLSDPPRSARAWPHRCEDHVDAAGNVNARLTVERTETLDLFQRDQRSLERALAQAGLDSSKTNLEFSLKQNPFSQQQGNQRNDGSPFGGFTAAQSGSDDTPALPSITLYRGTATAGGVNLFV